MSKNSENQNSFIRKNKELIKLLPAESTATFLVIKSIYPYQASQSGMTGETIFYLWAVAFIIFSTPFYLYYVWGGSNKRLIALVSFTFIIWVGIMDTARLDLINEFFIDYKGSSLLYYLNYLFVQKLYLTVIAILSGLIYPIIIISMNKAPNKKNPEGMKGEITPDNELTEGVSDND